MVLDATVYAWDFDAGNTRDLWVSTCGWVYRSRDGGDRWTRYTSGFTNRRSHSVRRDPTRPGVVYAATVGGLHRSDDGGATWARISRESLVVTALEVDRRTGRLYVGTEGEGVFTSDDGGQTLAAGLARPARGRVAELRADPNEPERVYFFRAFAGEETGVWEATGRDVRKVSRDALPASASLAAFRGPGRPNDASRRELDGIEGVPRRRRALGLPGEPPPALADRRLRRSVRCAGRGHDRRRFPDRRRIALRGGAGRDCGRPGRRSFSPTATATRSSRSGRAPTLAYWDGRAWSTRKKAALGGGIFITASTKPTGGYTNLQDVDGTLFWQEGREPPRLHEPAGGADAGFGRRIAGGRVYVGTMGDGLFLFEP